MRNKVEPSHDVLIIAAAGLAAADVLARRRAVGHTLEAPRRGLFVARGLSSRMGKVTTD